jgi:hypothetical protein
MQECKWLNVTAIDLCSKHRLIEERDFFCITPQQSFDVVVCSMVLIPSLSSPNSSIFLPFL